MCMVRSQKLIAGAPEVALGNSPYKIAIALDLHIVRCNTVLYPITYPIRKCYGILNANLQRPQPLPTKERFANPNT
jgi:hypothetical protein